MNIFSRIFKIFQSESHAAIDQLEDPIKMTEQGIRDLKEDLDAALKALAEVKAMAIRAKRETQSYKKNMTDYESKAISLLNRAQKGQLDAAEADRLAESALQKKEESSQQYQRALADQKRFDNSITKLDGSIKKIKSNISTWENELKTLKARAKVSKATKNVNKQLAEIDSSSTISLLERMKEKVEKDEALSEAYAEIANENKSLDDEIDSALGGSETTASDALAALKAKLNTKIE